MALPNGTKNIVAIGTDGKHPVVWGLGQHMDEASATREALHDARRADHVGTNILSWDAKGYATCEVTHDIVGRICAGELSCKTLGIDVKFDTDGKILSAGMQGRS